MEEALAEEEYKNMVLNITRRVRKNRKAEQAEARK